MLPLTFFCPVFISQCASLCGRLMSWWAGFCLFPDAGGTLHWNYFTPHYTAAQLRGGTQHPRQHTIPPPINERLDLVRRANTIDWHWKAHSPFHMPTHTLLGLHYQFGSFQPSSAATLSDYVIALLSGTTRPTAEQ